MFPKKFCYEILKMYQHDLAYLSFETLQIKLLLKILVAEIEEMEKLSERGQLDVGRRREDQLLELLLVVVRAPKSLNRDNLLCVNAIRFDRPSLKELFQSSCTDRASYHKQWKNFNNLACKKSYHYLFPVILIFC